MTDEADEETDPASAQNRGETADPSADPPADAPTDAGNTSADNVSAGEAAEAPSAEEPADETATAADDPPADTDEDATPTNAPVTDHPDAASTAPAGADDSPTPPADDQADTHSVGSERSDATASQPEGGTPEHDPWATDDEYAPADETAGPDTDAGERATAEDPAAMGSDSDEAATGDATSDSVAASDAAQRSADATELAPAPDRLSAEDTYGILRPARREFARYLARAGLDVESIKWLRAPFCYSAILREPDTGDIRYHVIEPSLSPAEASLRDTLEDQLRDELLFRTPATGSGATPGQQPDQPPGADDTGQALGSEDGAGGTGAATSAGDESVTGRARGRDDAAAAREQARAANLRAAVQRLVRKYDISVADESLRKIIYYLERDWIRFGLVDPLMHDAEIEEVSCDGTDVPVYVHHRSHASLMTNRAFAGGDLRSYVTKLAQRTGRDISIADPLEGASLPDGSRIELSLGEVTQRGPTFTIRKFRDEPFTPTDLVQFGTFTSETLAYLWEAITNGLSVLFVGGTASGKTTTLNATALFVPPKRKIVSIEDTRELVLPHDNWVPGVTREGVTDEGGISMQQLLRHGLRHRPELIAVGEVRGAEAGVLFQAMNTGHQALSTVHADSVRGLISRLENPPMAVERELISELDLVVIQAQVDVDDERVRRCTEIAELYDLDPDTRDLQTRTTWQWDEQQDTLQEAAQSRHMDRFAERGREPHAAIDRRADVLDYLVENDIADHQAVADVSWAYHLVPERVQQQVADDALDLDALRAIRERALSADTHDPGESSLADATHPYEHGADGDLGAGE